KAASPCSLMLKLLCRARKKTAAQTSSLRYIDHKSVVVASALVWKIVVSWAFACYPLRADPCQIRSTGGHRCSYMVIIARRFTISKTGCLDTIVCTIMAPELQARIAVSIGGAI